MTWEECIEENIIKKISYDHNLYNSLKEIASMKIESSKILPKKFFIIKITLLYDALREYLEMLALKHNYKIYNHECYVHFLKEILKKDYEAKLFNKIRIIRNKINYYGIKISEKESESILKEINLLIEKIILLL